jgi:hypothetical protein
VKSTVLRFVLGHGCGLALALVVMAFAPQIMDLVTCSLMLLHVVWGEGLCEVGSARLGEGGVSITWRAAADLASLVALMEVFLWLRRWYGVPAWSGPVVVLAGAPGLLALLIGFHGWDASAASGALVLGVPIVAAFTGYWIPLVFARNPSCWLHAQTRART